MGKILAIFAIFFLAFAFNGDKKQNFECEFTFFVIFRIKKDKTC
jgi:hypothetical protein